MDPTFTGPILQQPFSTYYMNVSNSVSRIGLYPSLTDSSAKLYLGYKVNGVVQTTPGMLQPISGRAWSPYFTVSTSALNVFVGVNVFNISITAENNIDKSVYTIIIYRYPSNQSDICMGILGSGYSYETPTAWSQYDLAYVLNPVDSSHFFLPVNFTQCDSTAQMKWSRIWWNPDMVTSSVGATTPTVLASGAVLNVPLGTGLNQLFLAVLAQDGFSTTKYRLNITVLSGDANLKAFSVVNVPAQSLTPSFSPTVRTYNLIVPNVMDHLDSFVGTLNQTQASLNWFYTTSPAQSQLTNTGLYAQIGSGVLSTPVLLQVGYTFVIFSVQSQDLLHTNYYNATILRLANDTSLASLNVYPSNTFYVSPLAPLFDPTILSYSCQVSYGSWYVNLNAIPVHYLATLSYTVRYNTPAPDPTILSYTSTLGVGANSTNIFLVTGDTYIYLRVTAQDVTKTYTRILINRISIDTTLKSLTTTPIGLGLQPSFTPLTNGYILTVGPLISSIQVTPTLNYSLASVGCIDNFLNADPVGLAYVPVTSATLSAPYSLVVGWNTLNCRVVAQDGVSMRSYNISVNRQSNDASLSALVLTPLGVTNSLVPTPFDPLILGYAWEVDYASWTFTFSAEPNFYLAHLSYCFRQSTSAAPASLSYIGIGNSVTSSPFFLETGLNYLYIKNLAQDGTIAYTTVTIHRISIDATLKALVSVPIGLGLVPSFKPLTFSYTITVGPTINVIQLRPTSNHTAASIGCVENPMNVDPVGLLYVPVTSASLTNGYGLIVGWTTLNCEIIAEDGITSLFYNVSVNRQSNDTDLALFRVFTNTGSDIQEGVTLPGFDYTITSYQMLMLPHSVFSVFLEVDVHHYLSHVSYIVYRTLPSGAPGSIPAGSFTPLPNNVNSTDIFLVEGWTYVYLAVTAQDGSRMITTLAIQRTSADSTLSNLISTPIGQGGGFHPAFTYSTFEYKMQVAATQNTMTFTPTLNFTFGGNTVTWAFNPGLPVDASVLATFTSIATNIPTPALTLADGFQYIYFYVTAQDGVTTSLYNVSINRASNDAKLFDLQVFPSTSPFTFTPSFIQTQDHYVMEVQQSCFTGIIQATVNYQLATLSYAIQYNIPSGTPGSLSYTALLSGSNSANLRFITGFTYIYVKCVAEDFTTLYTEIKIKRLSTDASLYLINTQPAAPGIVPTFSPTRLNYQVTYPSGTNSFKIRAYLNDTVYGQLSYAEDPSNLAPTNGLLVWNTLATNTLSPSINLVVGWNTVLLRVIADDPTVIQYYNVTVERLSSDSDLGWIELFPSGSVVSPLDHIPSANTHNYAITVGHDCWTMTFWASPDYYLATVEWYPKPFTTSGSPNSLPYTFIPANLNSTAFNLVTGDNYLYLRITAENGATDIYRVQIHRVSNDPTIANIVPDYGTLIPPFSPLILNYRIQIANSITNNRFKLYSNYTEQTYMHARDLTVVDQYQSGWSNNNCGGTVGTSCFTNNYIMDVGWTFVFIWARAEDTTTWLFYNISIERLSNDPSINTLVANPGNNPPGQGLIPAFQWWQSTYRITVPANTTNITFTGTPVYYLSTLFSAYQLGVPIPPGNLYSAGYSQFYATGGALSGGLTQAYPLVVGNQTVWFKGLAQDGTPTYYSVWIERISTDVDLKNITAMPIKVNNTKTVYVDLQPAFSPFLTAYTMYVPHNNSAINITAILDTALATMWYTFTTNTNQGQVYGTSTVWTQFGSGSYTKELSLDFGNQFLIIRVQAQDPNVIKYYNLTINRISNDSSIKFFDVALPLTLSPTFSVSQPQYTVNLPTGTSSAAFTLVPAIFATTFYNATKTHFTYPRWLDYKSPSIVFFNTYTGVIQMQLGISYFYFQINAQDNYQTYSIQVTIMRDGDLYGLLPGWSSPIQKADPTIVPTVFTTTFRTAVQPLIYTASFPYIQSHLYLNPYFATPDSVIVWCTTPPVGNTQFCGNSLPGNQSVRSSNLTDHQFGFYYAMELTKVGTGTYNTFQITSTVDAITYLIRIERRTPAVTLFQQNASPGAPFGAWFGFYSNQTSYFQTVPYRYSSIDTTIFAATTSTQCRWSINNGFTFGPWTGKPSGIQFSYPIGVTGRYILQCQIAADGYYTFVYDKIDPDLRSVMIRGTNDGGATYTPCFLCPDYVAANFIYSTLCSYAQVDVTTYFTVSGSVKISMNSFIQNPALANTPSLLFPVNAGTNTMTIDSVPDGPYTFYLVRDLTLSVSCITFTQDVYGVEILPMPVTPYFIPGQLIKPWYYNDINRDVLRITVKVLWGQKSWNSRKCRYIIGKFEFISSFIITE
jgi:hypothetical protein